MKRIYILFLLFFAIFNYFLQINDVFYEFFVKFPEYEFCYSSNIVSKNISATNRSVNINGRTFVYFQDKKIADYDGKFKHVFIKGDFNIIEKICKELNIRLKEKEVVGNKEIYFGYSPSFANYIWHGNEKINFQFAIENDKILIGQPYIYISF